MNYLLCGGFSVKQVSVPNFKFKEENITTTYPRELIIPFQKFRNEFCKIRLPCVHFAVEFQHYLQPFCFLLSKNYLFYLLKLCN